MSGIQAKKAVWNCVPNFFVAVPCIYWHPCISPLIDKLQDVILIGLENNQCTWMILFLVHMDDLCIKRHWFLPLKMKSEKCQPLYQPFEHCTQIFPWTLNFSTFFKMAYLPETVYWIVYFRTSWEMETAAQQQLEMMESLPSAIVKFYFWQAKVEKLQTN